MELRPAWGSEYLCGVRGFNMPCYGALQITTSLLESHWRRV